MKTGEISDLHLTAIIAGATLLGGVLSTTFSTWFLDANTERQADIQLVELAIGILSSPLSEDSNSTQGFGEWKGEVRTSQSVLRTWAVDTINQSAEVKFDDDARDLLVDGNLTFPAQSSLEMEELYRSLKEANEALLREFREDKASEGSPSSAPVIEVRPVIKEDAP